jgi:hypothetical protein
MQCTIGNLITRGVIAFVVIAGSESCSDSNNECKVVTVDSRKYLFEIRINPPGESGGFTQAVKEPMKITTNISTENGKEMVNTTQYEVNLEQTYKQSGNTYKIVGSIEYNEKSNKFKLIGYNLTITGGVYGETPYTCIK